jgi:hypothetical protein
MVTNKLLEAEIKLKYIIHLKAPHLSHLTCLTNVNFILSSNNVSITIKTFRKTLILQILQKPVFTPF